MILLLKALAFMSAFKHYSHQGFIGMEPEETPPPTGNFYVAEDGVTFYVAENGTDNYVPEV